MLLGESLCIHTRHKFHSNTKICYARYCYSNVFPPYWVIIRPSKEQIYCIKICSAFWDPKSLQWIVQLIQNYKFWYIGSVLWKAWWWFNRVETCCHKNILHNKLLCVTEIYTLYELDKHIGTTNVKLTI